MSWHKAVNFLGHASYNVVMKNDRVGNIKIVFAATPQQDYVLLGKTCTEIMKAEFEDFDCETADSAVSADGTFDFERYYDHAEFNVILPLSMPSLQKSDILSAIEMMKRQNINFISLGSKDSFARIQTANSRKSSFFVTGDAFLELNSAKNIQIVYNYLKDRIVQQHLDRGVLIWDPKSTVIDFSAVIESGAEIGSNTKVLGKSVIKSGAIVTDSFVSDTTIGQGSNTKYSYLTGAVVGNATTVGPYATITNSTIGEKCRIGDFVEVKGSKMMDGAKCAHLSYIGNAVVGKKTNIGCGTVFCNYDGKLKHKTKVGDNCFVGANTNLIAPITVGDNCFIAAGTTLCRDIDDDTFAIGRVRQETKTIRTT